MRYGMAFHSGRIVLKYPAFKDYLSLSLQSSLPKILRNFIITQWAWVRL